MSTVTILLVDDHPVTRQGLRSLLEAHPVFEIVGEADDGVDAVALAERLQPNILITALKLPGVGGFDVVSQVTARCKNTRCIVFTSYKKADYVRSAMKAGADGYVVKDARLSDIIEAITIVASGGKFVSDIVSDKPAQIFDVQVSRTDAGHLELLTAREREVLQLVVKGISYSEIAVKLFISPRTVETHKTNAMKKLGLRTKSALIRFAVRSGMLPSEPVDSD